jgi:tRNA(fMet)-specific endonuclease VapC
MRYMLDTNICIYAIKNRSDHLLAKLRANAAAGIGVSSICAAELHFGVAKTRSEKNAKALDQFLASLEIADFDDAAARVYGAVREALERAGTPIGPLDTQIAAHARQLGVILVTNNVREFVRVEGLQLENWAEELSTDA